MQKEKRSKCIIFSKTLTKISPESELKNICSWTTDQSFSQVFWDWHILCVLWPDIMSLSNDLYINTSKMDNAAMGNPWKAIQNCTFMTSMCLESKTVWHRNSAINQQTLTIHYHWSLFCVLQIFWNTNNSLAVCFPLQKYKLVYIELEISKKLLQLYLVFFLQHLVFKCLSVFVKMQT